MKKNDVFTQRLNKLQRQLLPHQAWLIATPSHITYLTNFQFLVPEEKEAFLIISAKKTWLIHASFCPTANVTSAVIRLAQTQGNALCQHILTITQECQELTDWFLDENILSITEYKILQTFSQFRLLTLNHQQIWELRMVKDEAEQSLCQQAGQIAQQTFQQLLQIIKVGMSEIQVKNILDNLILDSGADKTAFPTIIAFNQHSALPHHQPDQTILEPNSVVLIDFGANVQGYRSDMTRTFWYGKQPSTDFLQKERVIKQAYQQTLDKITTRLQNQLMVGDLDKAAREVINAAGYSTAFIHTTGHGVGLDIHEPPSIHWKNEIPIQPGMIITIEPGIYFLNKYGYRYENTILVTTESALELTT